MYQYQLKITAFFFLLLISTGLFAQDQQKSAPAADFKKFQVGINVSPDYSFRVLKNNDGSAYSNDVIKSRNSYEVPKLSYTAGLDLTYNFKKHIGIEIGIQYSNKGYQTRMQDLILGSMIDPRRGFAYSTTGPVPTQGKIIYNDYYLDIPLKANFTLGEKKIRFIVSAGIVTNIFLKETVTSVFDYQDGSHTRKTTASGYDYNQLDISPMISAGINWKLNNRSDLKIEPTFRYGVLKIIDAPVTGYLWSAGLNVGYYLGW